MSYWLILLAVLGIGGAAVWFKPSYLLNLVSLIFPKALESLKVFITSMFVGGRPKTPEEWVDWRKLSSMKPSDMSAKERARYTELKKLNYEYKD